MILEVVYVLLGLKFRKNMPFNLLRKLLFAVLFLISIVGSGQHYYVIIGSFSTELAATQFKGYARNLHFDANTLKNESSNLTYVYVLKTPDKKAASELALRLQRESEFRDAWMYHDTQGISTEEIIQPQPVTTIPVAIAEKPIVEEIPEKPGIDESPVLPEESLVKEESVTKPVVRGKLFNFKLTTTEDQEVSGIVYNVDRQQGRDLAAYKANTYADVLKPVVTGTPITIVCEIFGYAEEVKIIDYANPELTDGAYQDDEGAWVIPFTLQRLKKGDVSILYNVSFYKDAVTMVPDSQSELDELVNMMNLNPNYKIKIHSHNNGNEKNIRIIMLGDTKNYFTTTGAKSKTGSAKELTQLRAETIKSYLLDHGISKDRIETQGWGGAAMLLKSGTSAATRLNNRTEVEILQD